MQTLFIRGPSATFRMTVLVAASIALMAVDHQWKSLEFVRSTLSSILYPLQYTIDLPIRLYYWSDEVLSSQQDLLEKNREFEARHLENRVQLQKLDIIEKENERLRKLLGAIPKTTERLLVAEIISVDLDPYKQLILLNKGSSSDVYRGQPIIDSHGIMGQVVHVGPMSSTAMLITDASHAIPVQVNRNGLRAIAFGTGQIDQLDLRHLPNNVDIKEGDLLITSGLGQIFPPNYPVAVISKVDRPAGEPFARITARPHAQLDKSREVLLVWRNIPQPDATESTDKKTGSDGKDSVDEKKDTTEGEETGNSEKADTSSDTTKDNEADVEPKKLAKPGRGNRE